LHVCCEVLCITHCTIAAERLAVEVNEQQLAYVSLFRFKFHFISFQISVRFHSQGSQNLK
jgi:hypothetical protein